MVVIGECTRSDAILLKMAELQEYRICELIKSILDDTAAKWHEIAGSMNF
jgi:hypothetical protein